MGQKVNPHGFRVGVIKDWDSRWYARNEKVGDLIVEDQKIRKFLKKTLYATGVPRIEIERDNSVVRIYLHCARPGMILGKDATEVERLRQQVEKMIGKPTQLNIVEVKRNEVDTTTYGRIGIKVWIYKGEVLSQTLRTTPRTIDLSKPYRERSDRRRRDGRGRGGYNRNRDNNRSGGYNRRNDGASKPKEGGNR